MRDKVDRLRPDRLLLIVFGIEQDVDSGQFRHRLEQNPRPLIGHLQIDEIGVQRPQFRYRKQRIGPLLRALMGLVPTGVSVFSSSRCDPGAPRQDYPPVRIPPDHVPRAPDLLHGDIRGGSVP